MKKNKLDVMDYNRNEILKWCRYFYNTLPNIHYAITMMLLAVKSKSNPEATDIARSILNNVIILGEAFVFGNNNNLTLIEPECIDIYRGFLDTKIKTKLICIPEMKQNIRENNCTLSEKMKEKILKEQSIYIDATQIAYKTNPTCLRGTSLIGMILKNLLVYQQVQDEMFEKIKKKKVQELSKKQTEKLNDLMDCICNKLINAIPTVINTTIPQIEKCLTEKYNKPIKLKFSNPYNSNIKEK
jgi:hypothetical protein